MSNKLENMFEVIIPVLKEKLEQRLRQRPDPLERVKETIKFSYRENDESGRLYIYRKHDDSTDQLPVTGRMILMQMSDQENKDQEPFMAVFMPDEDRKKKTEITGWAITYADTDEDILVEHIIEYLLDGKAAEDLNAP